MRGCWLGRLIETDCWTDTGGGRGSEYDSGFIFARVGEGAEEGWGEDVMELEEGEGEGVVAFILTIVGACGSGVGGVGAWIDFSVGSSFLVRYL
jgi:hypothetical protein